MVEVQKEVFSIEEITSEVKALGSHIGAIVSFIGYVRDFDVSENKMLLEMRLEHYPGMTEKVLQTIEKKAFSKWDLSAVRIVHRVGILKLNDPIVAVVVASPHGAARKEEDGREEQDAVHHGQASRARCGVAALLQNKVVLAAACATAVYY